MTAEEQDRLPESKRVLLRSSLSDYDSSVSCNSGKNGAAGTSHTFTANYGDVITCTFTNHLLPQLKLANPTQPTFPTRRSSDLAGAQTFTNTGAGYGNGQDTGFHNVPQGSLTVSEAGHAPSRMGGAHVWTPVTLRKSVPSSACKTSTPNTAAVSPATSSNYRLPH